MSKDKKVQDITGGFSLIGKPSVEDTDPKLEAMFRAAFPIDRSLELPDDPDGGGPRKYIDNIILEAFSVVPVFSDYVLVSNKPTPAELGAILKYQGDDGPPRIPICSDDFLIIVADDRVEQLLTISRIPITGSVAYEVSFHSFKIDLWSILTLRLLRHHIDLYGLMSYPDSTLIDEHRVNNFGNGADSFLSDTRRVRPVFITRKSSTFPRKEREYLKEVTTSLSLIGLAIGSDKLFKEYGEQLGAGKLDIIAVPPVGEARPAELLRKTDLGLLPVGLDYFLAKSPVFQPDWQAFETLAGLGPTAKSIYSQWISKPLALSLDELRILGQNNENAWASAFAELEELDTSVGAENAAHDIAVHQVVHEEITPQEKIQKAPAQLVLDADGYPADSKDLAIWADRSLGDRIVILPKARHALKIFPHPEPSRIARALELLAGPKLETYRGDRSAQEEVNSKLISLRMRDGFSNAERLRGQKGEAYVVKYGGKTISLARHLASISSGFNDPRLIRIYYFYDKHSRKIVVGWLPSHLPTTQS